MGTVPTTNNTHYTRRDKKVSDMQMYWADAKIDVSVQVQAKTIREAEELVEELLAPWSDDSRVIIGDNNGVDVYGIGCQISYDTNGFCRCHDKEGSSK